MTTLDDFIAQVDASLAVLGHSESYLSRLVFDDGKVIGRLRAGLSGVTVARLDRAKLALAHLTVAAEERRSVA